MKAAWNGFVHVRPAKAVSALGHGAKGAYAHLIALATDEREFIDIISEEMAANDLYVVEASDVALVAQYERDGRMGPELTALSNRLSSQWPVQYEEFDTYYADDA